MPEQVLLACTVYDMCKQQDCLTPNCCYPFKDKYLISPSRNGYDFPAIFIDGNFTTEPNDIFYVPSNYRYVNIVEGSLETVLSVRKYKENSLRAGYYDLEIEYRFNYALEFSDMYYEPLPVYIQNSPQYQVKAYSLYIKNVTLYGGEIKSNVCTLTSTSAQCCSKFPEYNIQSSAEILSAELVKVSHLLCNPNVDQTKNNLHANGSQVVSITIGLFTIISLYRYGRVNVLTGDPLEIPTCHHYFEPCEDFSSEAFPYDLFNAEKTT